jgi:hypothetical protein
MVFFTAFSKKLSNKDEKKQWKKIKTKKMNKPWTLPYTLVLQGISFPLSFFFFDTNWFSLQNDAMWAKSQFDLS